MDSIGTNRKNTVMAAGVLSFLLGGIVLAGWYTGNTLLIQVHSAFAPMQYNAALGFLLSGAGLIALCLKAGLASFLIGVVVGALGILTLFQYVSGIDLGIDQLLMKSYITTQTSHPGRMAPNSAVCFTLIGMALIARYLPGKNNLKRSIVRALGLSIIILSVAALIGYAGSLETAYGWAHLTRMALHTAMGFLFLGAGLTIFAWFETSQELNTLARYWISGGLAGIVLFVSFALWLEILDAEYALIRQNVKEKETILAQEIGKSIRVQIRAIQRMRDRWVAEKGTPEGEWRKDARNYVKDIKSLFSVYVIDQDFNIIWNESFNRIGEVDLEKTREAVSRKQLINQTIVTMRGVKGTTKDTLSVIAPFYSGDNISGYIVGLFDIEFFLGAVIPETIRIYNNIEVDTKDSKFFFGDRTSQNSDQFAGHNSPINVFGDTVWSISIWPNGRSPERELVGLTNYLAPAGVLFAVLIFLIANYSIKSFLLSRRIEDANKLNKLILDNAGEGIYGLDKKGYTTFCNNAAVEMLGYTLDEMKGRPQHELIHYHYSDGSVYPDEKCNIYHAINEGKVHTEDQEVFWRKDGTPVSIEYTSKPIMEADGEITGAVVVFRDISERKEAESKLQEYTDALKRSNKELDEFAYVASHDLQAPLRGIDNVCMWLEEDLADSLDDTSRENLGHMRARVVRMEKLLNDLLEYSRIGRKLDSSDNEIISGKGLMENIVGLINLPEGFSIKANDALNEMQIYRMPIQQILFNLINNAIKHHDKDKGVINVSVEQFGEIYEFCVKDDGPGIDPLYHEKVFKIFQTLKPRDEVEGSGIGLAVVKKMIEAAGGVISLESEAGQGCVFRFTFPKLLKEELRQEIS